MGLLINCMSASVQNFMLRVTTEKWGSGGVYYFYILWLVTSLSICTTILFNLSRHLVNALFGTLALQLWL